MDEVARYRWIAAHILPYEAELRSWLRRRLGPFNGNDGDDVVQEAFARAIAERYRFRGEAPLGAWVWRIALRVAALGTFTSNGKRRSSAMRSIKSRIASEIDRPTAANASAARSLVAWSIRARTTSVAGYAQS